MLGALVEAGRTGSVVVTDLAADLGEAERALLLELASSEEAPDDEASATRVLSDTLFWLRERRDAAERLATTRRLAETPQDAQQILMEKQRQLERRRAAQGLDPTPPAPGGGVELLR